MGNPKKYSPKRWDSDFNRKGTDKIIASLRNAQIKRKPHYSLWDRLRLWFVRWWYGDL